MIFPLLTIILFKLLTASNTSLFTSVCAFTGSRLKLNNDAQQSWLSSTKTRQLKLSFKLQYTIKNNWCTKIYSRFQNCIRKKFIYSWKKCFDLKLEAMAEKGLQTHKNKKPINSKLWLIYPPIIMDVVREFLKTSAEPFYWE